jgi:hypothetical protein
MPRPDLSRLSSDEKDTLILALLERVSALEAKLGVPPKGPGNSSVPPSRGQKKNRPSQSKKARAERDGPGVTHGLAEAPDHVVDWALAHQRLSKPLPTYSKPRRSAAWPCRNQYSKSDAKENVLNQ